MDRSTPPDELTDARDDASPRRLALAVGAAAVLLCALMAYWLGVLHAHRIQFTERQLQQQTAALSEHASLVLEGVDALLQATIADIRNGRLDPASADGFLRWRAGGSTPALELELRRTDGAVMASSAESPWPADITLTRPVPGAMHGIAQVTAHLDAGVVSRFFARVASAGDARFGLFEPDGTRLAGNLDLAMLKRHGEDPATVLRELLEPLAPSERGPAFVAAQQLEGLRWIAVTSRDRQAVLQPWYEYVASASVITVLTVGLLALVMRRLQQEMRARARAQAALARSGEQTRRLEALGRLSGGIAHDFNNILAAILGYGDLLQQHAPPGSAAARHAEQLLRAGERGKRLVARILSFSRGGTRPQTLVTAQAVVAEAVDLLLASAPPEVTVERCFDAADAVVQGDATQLFELVQNLCTNALQAMQPSGGRLRISLFRRILTTPQTLSHGHLASGRYVVIEIADSGPGIDVQSLEHLFEPFFTTRAAEGGTGLGLAMVHGAMKEMNGTIDVRSSPGQGACFSVHLPLADGIASREDAPPAAIPRGAGQVVMIVDDEPALVTLAEEVLAGLGYEPAGFRDPERALAVLRETPDRFDALLLDQVMPALSGTDLAEQARRLRPDLPILLATGYGGVNLEQRARDAGVSVLLQKPLHRGELAQHLARVFRA